MSKKYLVALDQGTTSSRAVLIDHDGMFAGSVQREFAQLYPQPGWVEHDPADIVASQIGSFAELMDEHHLSADDIEAIGITNQRETTLVWDRATGEPIANAIVWQCRRTAPIVDEVCGSAEVAAEITARTGLHPDAYFSASKIKWLLDNVSGARERAEAGELCFGTVDSWLIWNLTDGAVHATDITNASRTMLYNIYDKCWDPWLLDLFGIPECVLPEVRESAGMFGCTAGAGIPGGIPIMGVAGDQQAALFGQCCFDPGQAKNTFGTGCFLLMHAGCEPKRDAHELVTTIAASAPGAKKTEYALEGSVFVAGALIKWLRDELGIIDKAAETEQLAKSIESTDGVYIVPAFTGLGAPYWQPDARGLICGLTRGTGRAHLARAALEALAYQLNDLVSAMQDACGVALSQLNVDGGAARNDFLLQFQSDISRIPIRRPQNTETTALGAAYLAGLASGFWRGTDELLALRDRDDVFEPQMPCDKAAALVDGWKAAVKRAL